MKRLFPVFLIMLVLFGCTSPDKQSGSTDGEFMLTFLGNTTISNLSTKCGHYSDLQDYDPNNFSIWLVCEETAMDTIAIDNGWFDYDASMYDIDFDNELLVLSINRKLKSLNPSPESEYSGMLEAIDGELIPHPPNLRGTFYPEYYEDTLFFYSIPKLIFQNDIAPAVYYWNNHIEGDKWSDWPKWPDES